MTFVPTNIPQKYNISEIEVLQTQMQLIKKWKPAREVWPLLHGTTLVGILSGLNGIVINGMYRKKLKLMHQGLAFTNVFMAIAPALSSYASHRYFIGDNILLLNYDCTLCLQLKAAASLCIHGVAYPMLLAPTLNLLVAGNVGYRIPYVHEVREIIKFVWSVLKPETRTIAIMLSLNVLLSGLLTLKQIEAMENVTNIVHKVQQYVEDERAQTNDTELNML